MGHVDQSPLSPVINPSHAGPEVVQEFFDTQTERKTWESKDNYMFDKKQWAWFSERGVKTHNFQAIWKNYPLTT